MTFSKLTITAFILILCSSCSTFSDAFKKAAVHEKMATQLDQTPYEMKLADLQSKIIEYMGSMNLNGKWIYTSSPGVHDREKMMAVSKKMEEGFTYKDNLYTSIWSPDMSIFSGDLEKIKKSIFTASYHVIESDENQFIIVKGNIIYEAHKAGPDLSSLKVYQLTNVVTPLTVNVDWWALMKGKGLLPTFEILPVDFASSRKYQVEDKTSKLSLFFFIDQVRAEKMEADLTAKQES